MMKILATRMANHPLYSTLSLFPAYYHYFHSLLTTPTNAPPSKTLSPKSRKKIPNWARTRLQRYSLKVIPIRQLTGWVQRLLMFMNLPLITSSLMNPLVQTSSHSPKNSDKDMHASRTYDNSRIKLGSESLPLCLLDFRHNNNPTAPQTKNRVILNHHHSLVRIKTNDYNVARKQKDNNKKNTVNE